jgi:hypothetical protein
LHISDFEHFGTTNQREKGGLCYVRKGKEEGLGAEKRFVLGIIV